MLYRRTSCNQEQQPAESCHIDLLYILLTHCCSSVNRILMKYILAALFLLLTGTKPVHADSAYGRAVERIRNDIEFFAADEQEGRGVATEGIERAAERIIAEYESIGLKPAMPDGSWRQKFDVKIGTIGLSDDTRIRFRHANGRLLTAHAGIDCQPLRKGGSGNATGNLMFVGYGISAPEFGYDEYANLDVTGKTVIVIRRVPGQGDPQAPFSGSEISSHAYIDTKLRLAKKNGAAAVLFVNDPHTTPDPTTEDLVAIDGFGSRGNGLPFVQVRQRFLNQMFAEQPIRTTDGITLTTLQAVCDHLDRTLTPLSQEMGTWSSEITVDFTGQTVEASNLVGVVEGEGPHSDETIIIGGHYDHIGFGDYGSRARSRRGQVHNGADDNASGTAAVLELARRVADGPPPARRIVFICFSGEERGLLGSKHYVQYPLYPLEDTIVMLNFDMIGTVRNNRVEINGVGTGAEFLPLVQQADDESDLDVKVVANSFGGSDHLPFYRKQIPVMFCFTGVTDRYHTPDDDIEMINMDGVAAVVDLSETLFHSIDQMESRPTFRRTSRGRKSIAVLGIRPDLSTVGNSEGVRVLGVRQGSPARNASVQVGDVIVKIDDDEIHSYADLNDFLRESSGGRKVVVWVDRDGQRIGLHVTLGQTSQ